MQTCCVLASSVCETTDRTQPAAQGCRSTRLSAHLVPVTRKIVAVVHQEVTPVHLDVGAYPEVLGAVAQLTRQVLGRLGPIEVLHRARHADRGRQATAAGSAGSGACVSLVQTVANL